MKIKSMHSIRWILLTSLLLWAAVSCEQEKKSTSTPISPTPGEKIWQANCRVCHFQGIAGAPTMGNKKLWAPRIAQGIDTLISHALTGYTSTNGETQMPAKGGNPSLSDEEIAQAVRYMISMSQ